jgi:hypothetical protein
VTGLVDPTEIEQIVGVERHATRHYARAVSVEQVVYILHSEDCRAAQADLRDCPFSRALDRGIDEQDWSGREDRPVLVRVRNGLLIPDRGEGKVSLR